MYCIDIDIVNIIDHIYLSLGYYRLRQQPNITIRFVTNTTKESRTTLLNRLHRIGFESITENDMFTSLNAAVQYVRTNKLSPLYLLTDDAIQEFGTANQCECITRNAVVVGLAPEQFNYEKMNEAFRFVTSLTIEYRILNTQ